MMRASLTLLLLAAGAGIASAQTPTGATPSGPSAGAPAITAQAATSATMPQLPGVALPSDTTVPVTHTIGWIRTGQTRSGLLEDGDYRMGDGTWCDIWYFDGTAGQRVTIELHSRAFDAYLMLLDPAGNKLADDTDGAGNHDAKITFVLRESGRHQLVVNNETDDVKTGPYTLILH